MPTTEKTLREVAARIGERLGRPITIEPGGIGAINVVDKETVLLSDMKRRDVLNQMIGFENALGVQQPVEVFVEFSGLHSVTHSIGPFEMVHVSPDEIIVEGFELLPDLSQGGYFKRTLAKRLDVPRCPVWSIQPGFRLTGNWDAMRVWSRVKPNRDQWYVVGQYPDKTPDQGS